MLGAGGGPEERGDVGAKGEDSSNIVSVCARLVFIDGKGESSISIRSRIQDNSGRNCAVANFRKDKKDARTCERLREGTWIQ